MLNHFSHVWLFVILWSVACQASLSMEFSKQEYWSGLPHPSPGDLPDPGMESTSRMSPTMADGFFTTNAMWEVQDSGPPLFNYSILNNLHMPVPKSQLSSEEMQTLLENISSVQFSSVTQSCPTLCNPMNHSTPGLTVHHQLPEPTQTHVHWVSDAIQPSHPLSSSSAPALNLSQHQSFFKWVISSHQVAKILEFQLQHQSFQRTSRTDLL